MLTFALAAPLAAQIMGPGRRGRVQGRGRQTTTGPSEVTNPAGRFTGTLQRLSDKTVSVEIADSQQVIDFRCTRKTRFFKESDEIKASVFKSGDRVTVEATREFDGVLSAVNVYLEESQPEKPSPPPAEGSDHRVLKQRAAPEPAAPQSDPAGAPAKAPSTERVEPPPPDDPMIRQARTAAESFSQTLPNYICQESVSRFVTDDSSRIGWKPLDVVSAEVVYESGRESYRNLAVDGNPVKQGMQELGGAWSTGEFGTLLRDLFSPSTAARFRLRGESTIAGRAAAIYDFEVEGEHSHWRIQVGSKSITPAYKGALWIDKETARVLRAEMKAREIPAGFPVERIESAVDYQYVQIGTAQFLLPVHAETVGCQRGAASCNLNGIGFRNCHKYASESEIIFERPK